MTGKEFENLCKFDMDNRTEATMCRYGVQVNIFEGQHQVMKSLPDFEGVLAMSGRQFTFECKVCSQASFPINTENNRKGRQLRHLMCRSEYGAITFYLIHFNRRVLKTRTDEPCTYAFPTHHKHPYWRDFEFGDVKSITRQHCEEYAYSVPWHVPRGCRKVRPNVLKAINGTAAILDVADCY